MADQAPDASHDQVLGFLHRCRRRLEAVAADDEARAATDALATAIARAEPRPYAPSWLPPLDSIDRLVDDTADPEPGDDLIDDFVALAPALPWIPTHRSSDGGTELALARLDRVFDLGRTTVGLMYVGPDATYPLHRHPPQELYLTIAGEGRWRYGGNEGFEPIGPKRTVYNHPGDLHSAVAGRLPVVALYILWGVE